MLYVLTIVQLICTTTSKQRPERFIKFRTLYRTRRFNKLEPCKHNFCFLTSIALNSPLLFYSIKRTFPIHQCESPPIVPFFGNVKLLQSRLRTIRIAVISKWVDGSTPFKFGILSVKNRWMMEEANEG
ncbi:CLUMA_CG016654, isoform A [Clunio marinus]|uniref:CLUMA_CG016654, isoform A n=1 Tax=Clunio marinus TaxID=568069 RepID=A0A1J1IXU8_9DIPT|nr:CLUMA_CG016654, isoform A [Clunio marinus]